MAYTGKLLSSENYKVVPDHSYQQVLELPSVYS